VCLTAVSRLARSVLGTPYRRTIVHMIVGASLAMPATVGCAKQDHPAVDKPSLAVTTSYIECAVNDLTRGEFHIARLLPPGGCPGHFDLAPHAFDQLRHSELLFRFHFQEGLDQKLGRLVEGGLRVAPLHAPDGLSVPSTYEAVCAAACDALCDRWPKQTQDFRARLAEVRQRLNRLGDHARRRIKEADLLGAKVLASGHQAAFCRWLGLNVVGTFAGDQVGKLSELADAVGTQEKGAPRLIVANRQEGDRLARALADRLGGRCVVLSNFPTMEPNQSTFDAMVADNIHALVQGGRP